MIVDCIYHKREFCNSINDCLLVTCCKTIIRNVNFHYNYDELISQGRRDCHDVGVWRIKKKL